MNDDSILWEDNPDFNKVTGVKFGERDIKPSMVTIDIFTEAGKRKYNEGVSIKDFVEGTDFVRIEQAYESLPRVESARGMHYYFRKKTETRAGMRYTKTSFKAKAIPIILLALQYLSPSLQNAKEQAEKHLSCREYKVERDNRGEYLVGIDCRVKEQPRLNVQPSVYKI